MQDVTPLLCETWLDNDYRPRFWEKVDKNGPMPDRSDPLVTAPYTRCWIWTRALNRAGYGFFVPRPPRKGRTPLAHRISYMEIVGPIPRALEIDHLCRNRACVNPEHLEPKTRRANQLAGDTLARAHSVKTHCPAGHAYDEKNTRISARNQRTCRECRRLRANAERTDPAIKAERALKAREYRARLRAQG